jgi:hypothetical protein
MNKNKTVTVKSHVRKVTPSKKIIIKTGYKGDYRFIPVRGIFVDTYKFLRRFILSLLIAIPAVIIILQLFIHINESANFQKELINTQEELMEMQETNKKLKDEMSKNMVKCSPSKNESVNKLLNKYFKTCNEVNTIWGIAQAESQGKAYSINKNNRNGSWDCGYLQINTIHRKKGESKDAFCERMHNLETNIAMAAKVYKEAGNSFTPWVTFNKDLHLSYLK